MLICIILYNFGLQDNVLDICSNLYNVLYIYIYMYNNINYNIHNFIAIPLITSLP